MNNSERKNSRSKKHSKANPLNSMDSPISYEQIVHEIPWINIPNIWKEFDFEDFSEKIKLHSYQSFALKNAARFLYLYYKENHLRDDEDSIWAQKSDLLKRNLYGFLAQKNQNISNLDLKFKKNDYKKWSILREYYSYSEPSQDDKTSDEYTLSFENFVNRISFWMATGSGKSLIIIKLILFLHYLIQHNEIPNHPIMILTQRDDLIAQFTKMIDDYNLFNSPKIIFDSLKTFGRNEYLRSNNNNQINVYIYRSDLIAEQSKEKELSYNEIENDGKWYLFLDEAHKGDADDSIRKLFFSILSRNGFLFNFSATFTDDWDIYTTIFNFNLGKFIVEGYGKNIFVFQNHLCFSKGCSSKRNEHISDHTSEEEIISFLKPLILFSYISWAGTNIIREYKNALKYHSPLLVCLVNSVNVDLSDLERFFLHLGALATGAITEADFNKAKAELSAELKATVDGKKATKAELKAAVDGKNGMNAELNAAADAIKLKSDSTKSYFKIGDNSAFALSILDDHISFSEFKRCIFHSEQHSMIEILIKEDNQEELVLKLKSSEIPFALIKIGDIKPWIREKLKEYEIIQTYTSDKAFLNLNSEDNPIRILMGSRSFYEGWDSNRPNMMIFLNIGNIMAKKFAIQAIGRGLRIEPIPNVRSRLRYIKNITTNQDLIRIADTIHESERNSFIYLIETLFIFGTNSQAIITLLDIIKSQSNIFEVPGEDPSHKEVPINHQPIEVRFREEKQQDAEHSRAYGIFDSDLERWVEDRRVIFALRKMRNRT
jgi:type III restriction enzyme